MSAGTCKYCGCSEQRACPGGCTWSDETRTVCAPCADGEIIAKTTVLAFNMPAIRDKVRRSWTDLPGDDRRGLVTVCRTVADRWLEGALADVAGPMLEDIHALLAFLEERFAGEQRENESPMTTAIRLLTEGRTSRIVIP